MSVVARRNALRSRVARTGLALLAALVLAGAPAQAEEIYKSVDESGAVTYGDRPAADAVVAEPVPVEPGPSDEQVEAARTRAEQTIRQAEEMEKERSEKAQARAQTPAPAQPTVIVIDRDDERPAYGYPGYYPPRPWPPGHRYPPSWAGPGDHPAYRPGRPPRPRPPARPEPYPQAPVGARIGPVR